MILALALGYFTLGFLSLKLATINEFASPFWSPSGLAVGSLALGGLWLAPGVFLGALLTNFTVSASPISLIGIATGNMLEAIVGAYLISYILKKNSFKSYTEFVGIFTVAALASVVSATVGITTLFLLGTIPAANNLYSWYTWWSGDAVGIIIVLPFFVELVLNKLTWKDFELKQVIGSIIVVLLSMTMTYLVFVENYNQAFSWILCPFLILTGLFFGKKNSRLLLICVAFYIVLLAQQGYGPFEFGDLNLNLIYLQCLLISYSFSILFVRPLTTGFMAGRIFAFSTLIGWAIVFVVIFITTATEKKNLTKDLEDLIHTSVVDIEKDATRHELLLEASKAVLQIKRRLLFSDWKQYVESLDMEINYPALRGLGFVREIQKDKYSEYLSEIKDLGIDNFSVREIDSEYAKNFNSRYLMTYIEPLDKNLEAQGLDIGSHRQRRLAADEARKNQKTISTDLIQLVQDNEGQTAFSLLHPVWLHDQFKGWVAAPVSSQIFFEKSFASNSKLLNLKVTHDKNVLYQKADNDKKYVGKQYFRNIEIPLFGLPQHLEFYPTTLFFQRHSHSSAPLALLLSLFMLFIAGLLLEQMTFNQRAELLIEQRTNELEESNLKLVYSSKMASLGEMASSVAHEINNPITIILGKIKVISFMLADNVDKKLINEEIKKIEFTTGRISKIVKGLKTFSRVADEDPFELIPLEVIIEETMDLCSERLKNNGITLQMDKIPEICLLCRSGQISQVFLNLLNNSSDALMNQQNKVITWKFEIKEPDRFFIYISDTGAGIPKEIRSRIMEPFFTTKGVGKGTGLGLSIAKGIIEDHGGQITLDTNSKETRFIIEMPLKNV